MQQIIGYISEVLMDQRARFVFPSDITAKFWAKETARITKSPLDEERFLAWDTFKANALSNHEEGKQAIQYAVRTLFASHFLQENRRGKMLGEYIPPQYADSYSSFIASLAKLLPGLDGILRRPEAVGLTNDAYFKDLRLIYSQYTQFLEDHKLYEPVWNRAAFQKTDAVWLLFFPELAEDWEEYREELEAVSDFSDHVRVIPLESIEPPEGIPKLRDSFKDFADSYIHFRSTSDELQWVALTCRRLLDEFGLCPEDIAISVAGRGNFERLIHTFRLYDLYADVRQDKPIPKLPGGRIFSALAACQSKHWSYQSLANLLLDQAFPWKERESIAILMEFGLRYHCVSGFFENGREIDVWEKTFEQHRNYEFMGVFVSSIELFYDRLKKDLLAVVNAKSFSDIRKSWHIFQKNHFDSERMNEEVRQLIGKALASLNDLIEIEEDLKERSKREHLPELYTKYAGKALLVFQANLQEVSFGYQAKERGIRVYAYRVAAGIAPPVHFVVNVNQDDATVIYDGRASFLREDRKSNIGAQDRDISAEFIKAYKLSASVTLFSTADRTFSGVAAPHRKLSELLKSEIAQKDMAILADPYEAERDLMNHALVGSPPCPSALQKRGWDALSLIRSLPFGSDLRAAPMSHSDLRTAIENRLCEQRNAPPDENLDENEPSAVKEKSLSPSYLDEYLECPFKWVLRRGLTIREKQTEIETLNQRDMGRLYHRILERLWTRIKEEGGRFHADFINLYKQYLAEEITIAIDEAQTREGYFQKPVYDMLRPRITASLENYLELDAENLQGAEILRAEYPLRKEFAEYPALSGIADVVLEKNGFILRDYKTKTLPLDKDLWADDTDFPKNVQMASYIAMLETPSPFHTKETVRDAQFYSIDNRDFRAVVDREERPRENYNKETESVDLVVKQTASAMQNGEYMPPKNIHRKRCAQCEVSSVCRKPFIGE